MTVAMQMAQPSPAALKESRSSLVSFSFINTWDRFGIKLFNFSPLQSVADGNPAPTSFCSVEGRGLGDTLSKC